MLAPLDAAASLGALPRTEEGRAMAIKGMQFLGIRDIAVASALCWFHRNGQHQTMGVVLTAWVLVCVTDTYIASQGPRGWDSGIWVLCAGAGWMAFVGAGLAQA